MNDKKLLMIELAKCWLENKENIYVYLGNNTMIPSGIIYDKVNQFITTEDLKNIINGNDETTERLLKILEGEQL